MSAPLIYAASIILENEHTHDFLFEVCARRHSHEIATLGFLGGLCDPIHPPMGINGRPSFETFARTLGRELQEEIGLDPNLQDFLHAIISGDYSHRDYLEHHIIKHVADEYDQRKANIKARATDNVALERIEATIKEKQAAVWSYLQRIKVSDKDQLIRLYEESIRVSQIIASIEGRLYTPYPFLNALYKPDENIRNNYGWDNTETHFFHLHLGDDEFKTLANFAEIKSSFKITVEIAGTMSLSHRQLEENIANRSCKFKYPEQRDIMHAIINPLIPSAHQPPPLKLPYYPLANT